jgi:acetolactate synthase-1/2/3 large subunit
VESVAKPLPHGYAMAGQTPLVGDHPTAADVVVATLEQLGVGHVFGVPGGAIEPLYDAMARSQRRGGLRSVVARHEAGAAFMADGYARETGLIGVCAATSGPGATNLLTGIASAYENGIPLLVITGQPPIHTFGKSALQESACTGINAVAIFRYCTRYSTLVSHVDQLETKLISALKHALLDPMGPVHLSIPVDIQRSMVKRAAAAADLTSLLQTPPSLVDTSAVDRLVSALLSASRVVLLVGEGCTEAVDPIMALIAATGADFIATPGGKGLVNTRHPRFHGVFGFAGHASAEILLETEPDVILAIGTGFGELSSSGWSRLLLNNRLIHVDAREENFSHTPMARLHVRGRIASVCRLVLTRIAQPASSRVDSSPDVSAVGRSAHVILDAPDAFVSSGIPIKPQRLMMELARRFPPGTRFLADAGNGLTWAIHYLDARNRRLARPFAGDEESEMEQRARGKSWLHLTMDFAAMGWAIGAAVGLARASSTRPVVCITGDGSYLMSGQEITVAAAEGLCVIFVVLNDGAYGMVMHGQRMAGAEQIGYELPQVDYRLMAMAMGIPGHVIDSPADLDAIDFDEILARKGPTMLDVRIDPEEVPPMFQRVKALGSVT